MDTSKSRLLSKTKLMRGYRCLKSVYLTVHKPDLEAPATPEHQALFDQGNMVGEFARKRFEHGVLIENEPWDFTGSLENTKSAIIQGAGVLFEAAFEHQGCYARADIIRYSPVSKCWSIFEVKSSTKVKPEHIDDIALQTWIITNAGLPIERICILHLNPDCRFPNLDDLFLEVDLTTAVRERSQNVAPKIQQILSTIQDSYPPQVDIGPQCYTPNECGFQDTCWKERSVPEISVLDIPNLKEKKWEWFAQGKVELLDLPLEELSNLQKRMVQAHRDKSRFVDSQGIQDAISTWKFPLIFLDFETINPAIPRFNQCGPYRHIPFQFSVHVLDSFGSEVQHREFLHCGKDDPRPTLIKALIDACKGSGSVVSYYSRFEMDRIKELILLSSESEKGPLESIIQRMVDPLPVIRNNVYDVGFNGSFSLKMVAPALLGGIFSYDNMMVSNGTAAQRAFEAMITCDDENRRKELRLGLLEYCKKDTHVMVELVKWLSNQ